MAIGDALIFLVSTFQSAIAAVQAFADESVIAGQSDLAGNLRGPYLPDAKPQFETTR